MQYSKTFVKQSPTGLSGHIYEHVMANMTDTLLIERKLLPILDYEMRANSYDGIVVISIEVNDARLVQTIETLLSSASLNRQLVANALEQVSCEYGRLHKANLDDLFAEIQKVHKLPWEDRQKSLVFAQPVVDKDSSLTSQAASIGRRSTRSFDEFTFTYTIKDCPLELKPLAAYLIQTLALSHINLFYRDIEQCYDLGDEWAEYQPLVGYLHTLRTPKRLKVSVERLQKLHTAQQANILACDFSTKLVDFIAQQSKLDFPYITSTRPNKPLAATAPTGAVVLDP